MTVSQNDVVEISARGEFNGVEDTVNVYQFQLQSAGTLADVTAILQLSNHVDSFYDDIEIMQTDSFLYRDLSFRNVTTNTVMGVVPWPVKVAGTIVGTAAPPGIAGLVNMATSVARVVLRKYIGGLSNQLLELDGSFGIGTVANLAAFGAALIATYVTGSETWEYGYLSPKTGLFEVPAGATVTDIPAYQRRRKQGRGV